MLGFDADAGGSEEMDRCSVYSYTLRSSIDTVEL